MRNSTISYLNFKTTLIALTFFFLTSKAMELQNANLFDTLPQEIVLQAYATIAPDQKTYQEAIKTVCAISATNKSSYEIIKTDYFNNIFIQNLQHKFGISRLIALHGLHTPPAQEQFTESMVTIARYAYLNYAQIIKNIKNRSQEIPSTQSLTTTILEKAYEEILLLTSHESWKQINSSTQKQYTQPFNKDDLSAHKEISETSAENTINDLEYLARNITIFIKENVIDRKLLPQETLFALIYAELFALFDGNNTNITKRKNK